MPLNLRSPAGTRGWADTWNPALSDNGIVYGLAITLNTGKEEWVREESERIHITTDETVIRDSHQLQIVLKS